jgi:methylated-DNA-[protein]-cysteine S-methyltransferase
MTSPSARPRPWTVLLATHDTPAGPFTFAAGPEGVLAAGFTTAADEVLAMMPARWRDQAVERVARVDAASDAVDAWSTGDVEAPLDVAVEVEGTTFQRRAWAELRRIPAGRPLTYGGLAAALGTRSARAAGQGCATNPTSLFVPCHRVVGADGSVRGFAWGLAVKERLLAHEAAHARGAAPRPPTLF